MYSVIITTISMGKAMYVVVMVVVESITVEVIRRKRSIH